MADITTGLPIRTESAGDAIIKICDATVTTQQLKVNADGSIDTNFAAGAAIEITDGTDTLAVNADGSINVAFAAGAQIQITDGTDTLAVNVDGSLNAVVTATDLDIRNLVFATDKVDASGSTLGANDGVDIGDVTINNAAGASAVNIQDGGNSITVDGSVTVSATDLDIRDLTSVSDSVSVLQATHDNLNLNANLQVGDADVANGNPVPVSDAGGSLTVDATALDIRALSDATDSVSIGDGTDTLAVNTDGSINVRVSDRSGTEVDDYDTAAAVASAATSNHDYTTTGTFRLTQAHISASSAMKAELQIETGAATNVFNTLAVMFTSEANQNYSFKLDSPKQVTSGARVRIIRTNRDNQAQDLYSTILGYNE